MASLLKQSTGMTRDETRTSLRLFGWNAVFRAGFETICGGSTFVFVAFAGAIGVAKERMGLVTSLISVACILQILALPLSQRAQRKKRFALVLAFMEPVLVAAAVLLVPWLVPGIRLGAFAVAIFLAAAFMNLSRPLTDEWFASTIPEGIRGRYLGRRLQFYSLAMVGTALAAGQLVEWMGTGNLQGLSILLGIGALSGLAAIVVLREATMPPLSASSGAGIWDAVEVLRKPEFRRVLVMVTVYNLPFFFACPYYQVFNLEVAKMPPTMISYMMAGYWVMKIVTLPLLGRLVDRWGPRRAVLVAGIVYTAFFVSFLFVTPGHYWPLMLAWALVAPADGAFSLAVSSALYDSIPHVPARPAYFAVYNVLSLGFTALGGAAAVPALEALKTVDLHWGGLHWGNFHVMYGLCMLLMIPCLFSGRLLPARRTGPGPTPGEILP